MPTAKCTSYDEHVAAALGSSLTASGSGGSNYAYSGGVVLGSNSALTAAQPNLALQQQIANYTAQGVRPESLQISTGGGNDMAADSRARPKCCLADRIGERRHRRRPLPKAPANGKRCAAPAWIWR